ncbi:MAG TPA: hypothetical protein V6C88_09280 [Chroococcidiopsis sp.]
MEPEQLNAIIDLRAKSLTAKQIAKKLGLRVSDVTTAIRTKATQEGKAIATGEKALPIAECLVDIGCAQALLGKQVLIDAGIDPLPKFDDSKDDEISGSQVGVSGLGMLVVTRTKGYNRLVAAAYMIDYWCLGVKNAIEPRSYNGASYKQFLAHIYQGFPEGYVNITLEQAQSIAWGAADYAASLGFQPHPDFDKCKNHLGRDENLRSLTFGRLGQPMFVNGPYDDVDQILDTLRKNVGEGNYDYVIEASDPFGYGRKDDFFLDMGEDDGFLR